MQATRDRASSVIASNETLVVLLYASRGEYNALNTLLACIPPRPGITLILMAHPELELDEKLVRSFEERSRMKRVEAQHGSKLEGNAIFVVPPGMRVTIAGNALWLEDTAADPGQAELETTLDTALRTLAADQQERAIAIVLSERGTDGTRGLREIKGHGGVAIVNASDSDAMSEKQAAAASVADFALAPEAIPELLVKYAQHGRNEVAVAAPLVERLPDEVHRLLALIEARKKGDFRHYKAGMVMRRIRRRMLVTGVDDLASYVEYARRHPAEIDAIYKELLVGATAFFRDPEAFDALADCVLPELRKRSAHLRVWVAGCATGQEAYSLAMLLAEQAGDGGTFRIYATDIDSESLDVARRGVYPLGIAADMPHERLMRFFTKIDERHYQVAKELRDSVVFAKHNLLSDPPFFNVDLISCRNLFIYLEPSVQARAVSLFHFALKPNGYLMMTPAEFPPEAGHLFLHAIGQRGLYRKVYSFTVRPSPVSLLTPEPAARPASQDGPSRARPSWDELLRKAVLEEFLPASVLVNRQHEILAVQGPLVSYVEFPPGVMSSNLLMMARQGLRAAIRRACREAAETGKTVRNETACVKRDGAYVACTITVRRLVEPSSGEPLLLVVFNDRFEDAASGAARLDGEERSLLRQLESEVASTREELNATIQELVRANEELKTSNADATSANRELKAANDELETSKEELQSLNEELSLLNARLREKLEELDGANDDISNLISASDIATVFLDTQLNIKRFTPPTLKLLSLRATDVGRSFRDLAPKFRDERLLTDCDKVMTTLQPIEREVQAEERRWYMRRILPYRTNDGVLNGVVITFFDISRRIAAEARARLLADVLLESQDAVIVQRFDGRIGAWNRGAEALYGYTEAEAADLKACGLVPEALRADAAELAERVRRGEVVAPFETQRRTRDGKVLDVWVTVTPLRDEQGQPIGLATTERDVTARRRAESKIREANRWLERRVEQRTAALQRSEERIRGILDSAVDAIITIDARGTIETFNDAAARMFRYTPREAVGQSVKILMPPPYSDEHDEYLHRYFLTGNKGTIGPTREVLARRKDGSTFPVELSVRAVDRLHLFTASIRDISERKALHEEILRIAALEQQRIGQELHDTVKQDLTGLSLWAGNLQDDLVRAGLANESAIAERLSQGLDTLHQRVHLLAEGLMPAQVSPEELVPALQVLADRTTQTYGVECRLEHQEPVAVASETVATHLFRIAQEAVTNSIKHAKPATVRIELSRHDDEIQLAVEDDGEGVVVPKDSLRTGLGLRIIRYRAALIGGSVSMEARESGGTRVACRLPAAQIFPEE